MQKKIGKAIALATLWASSVQ